jgi:hypothetical protein
MDRLSEESEVGYLRRLVGYPTIGLSDEGDKLLMSKLQAACISAEGKAHGSARVTDFSLALHF